MSTFPNLFQSGRIGSLTVKNRIIMAPMGTRYGAETLGVSDRLIAYYAERAKGGVGLIIVEATCVDRKHSGLYYTLTLDRDAFIPGHAELVEAVHRHGAAVALQLFHPGRHADPDYNDGHLPVAPSPLASPRTRITPRELSVDDIKELVAEFGAAARRAQRAGYDALEVHGGHGHLLHQFLSPRINQRTDEYGGSLENRMRFSAEVIRSVKAATSGNLPVLFRITAQETRDGGYSGEDACAYARMAVSAGADAIHVTAGTYDDDKDNIDPTVSPQSFPQGWLVPYAHNLRNRVTVPVIAVGVIRDPQSADEVVAQGRADFIALGRPLLADPEWPLKAAEDRVDDIRQCCSCLYCIDTFFRSEVRCAVNAACGREREFAELKPAVTRKKVMVIGAGAAGMEAARIAWLRGHTVTLYEKGPELGSGQLQLCAVPPYKDKMSWVRDYLITQITKLGIPVRLLTEVDAELVRQEKPDVIILTTGARSATPAIPGAELSRVVTALDVLRGKAPLWGRRVVVIGGYSTGCETAEFLAEKENQVAIVSRSPARDLGRGVISTNRVEMLLRLRTSPRVAILNECDVKQITPNGVTVSGKDGVEKQLSAEWVVLARGLEPVNELAGQLAGLAREVYTIGDALRPRDIASAIYEGAVVGRKI
ncbi:MAG: FAD-dependent oxidoreductase [Chloroflexi bacterium]|nr:FAD-dependent oxidoreductase [Chloroflexota bacterium]